MTRSDWLAQTRQSYDTVVAGYAELVRGYPADEPYDRAVFALFAELAGAGSVADVGCGPGHVTAHLRSLGVDAFGIDLSPQMVARAQREHPGLRFEVGSMTALDLRDGSLAGLLAWYSLIHLPDEAAAAFLRRARRVLRPGGVLLLGFQVGDERRHKTEGYGGHPMSVDLHLRPVERVAAWAADAGLTIEAQIVQDPGGPLPHGRLLARACA